MSKSLEDLKRQSVSDLFESIKIDPTKCPFAKSALVHAYGQAFGVMYAYMDARGEKGIDAHQFAGFTANLRGSTDIIGCAGVKTFLDLYNRIVSDDPLANSRRVPLLKGMETLTKILDIEVNEPLKGKLNKFDQWRKASQGRTGGL